MSNGNRFGNLTLTLTAAAALVFMAGIFSALLISEWSKVHQVNAAYQQNAKRDRTAASQEIAESCEGVTGSAFHSCIVDHLNSYYRDQATNEDLKAQKDMAFWAMALFCSSTVLTGIGIYLLWQTLEATRETLREAGRTTKAAHATVDETRRIGEAQVRAYVNISNVRFDIVAKNDPVAQIKFVYANSGNSPAKRISIIPRYEIFERNLAKNIIDKQIYLTTKPETVALPDVSAGSDDERKFIAPRIDVARLMNADADSFITITAGYVISYEDVFGEHNFHDFRFRYTVSGPLAFGKSYVLPRDAQVLDQIKAQLSNEERE